MFKSFSLFSSSRTEQSYKDLITYKKELNDQRVFLQILQNLPPMYSNRYYQEQSQEQQIPPGLIYDEAKELAANKTTTSADWQTSDIIGKYLHEFRRLPHRDNNQAPIIFWLVRGFFEKNDSANMKHEGLFRVACSMNDLFCLEMHMAFGNYSYIE